MQTHLEWEDVLLKSKTIHICCFAPFTNSDLELQKRAVFISDGLTDSFRQQAIL